ncbi:MAG TPA: regulatory protein RecX [Flavitalea sp.]|nr:regulatory protein RecX [Flavitalea sp.]
MLHRKRLTPDQALQRAKLYCAYQERCHSEVKEKLYSFGLYRSDVEKILSELIEDDYLNEERFAAAFARGKFRMKNWGRVKIKYELKQKNVTEYCIRKALKEIEDSGYLKTLSKLKDQKLAELKEEANKLVKKKKVIDYLLQKGYERELIFSLFKE